MPFVHTRLYASLYILPPELPKGATSMETELWLNRGLGVSSKGIIVLVKMVVGPSHSKIPLSSSSPTSLPHQRKPSRSNVAMIFLSPPMYTLQIPIPARGWVDVGKFFEAIVGPAGAELDVPPNRLCYPKQTKAKKCVDKITKKGREL